MQSNEITRITLHSFMYPRARNTTTTTATTPSTSSYSSSPPSSSPHPNTKRTDRSRRRRRKRGATSVVIDKRSKKTLKKFSNNKSYFLNPVVEKDGGNSFSSTDPSPRNISVQEIELKRTEKELGFNPKIRKEGWKNTSLFSTQFLGDDDDDDDDDDNDEFENELEILDDDDDDDDGKNYKNGKYCFLCFWGDNGEDPVREDPFNEMIQIWMDNVHCCGEEELAVAISEFQYQRIYIPMRAKGKKVGLFPYETVLEHFNIHVTDPRFEAFSIIRSLKLLRREIEKNLKKVNVHTREIVIDKDQVSNYDKCINMMERVYKWDVKKMIGFVDKWRIDTQKTKSVFSLQRQFEFTTTTTTTANTNGGNRKRRRKRK